MSENNLFNLFFLKLMNQLSQNNLCHQIQFNSIWIKINLVSLLQRCCQCNDLSTHIALSISESIYLMFLCQLVSLLQWSLFLSHSEFATIDISMINRKIDRKMSIELYVSAMNYITSHRDMTFKEKKVMLWSVSRWNRV